MDHVRIDKWFWAARFFKTRSAATEAVVGGRVQLNGTRVKRQREVRVADTLEIRRRLTQWTVVAAGWTRSAAEARALVAEEWIQKNRLTGILTLYPVDITVYEWAIERGMFTPSKPHEQESAFIGGFTTASQPHHHYEAGRLDS